ncbi:unnamed protein product, partial [Fasciola hepatica]
TGQYRSSSLHRKHG